VDISNLLFLFILELEYIPIVCISASRVVDGAATDSEYIQGAADDHETWSKVALDIVSPDLPLIIFCQLVVHL